MVPVDSAAELILEFLNFGKQEGGGVTFGLEEFIKGQACGRVYQEREVSVSFLWGCTWAVSVSFDDFEGFQAGGFAKYGFVSGEGCTGAFGYDAGDVLGDVGLFAAEGLVLFLDFAQPSAVVVNEDMM